MEALGLAVTAEIRAVYLHLRPEPIVDEVNRVSRSLNGGTVPTSQDAMKAGQKTVGWDRIQPLL